MIRWEISNNKQCKWVNEESPGPNTQNLNSGGVLWGGRRGQRWRILLLLLREIECNLFLGCFCSSNQDKILLVHLHVNDPVFCLVCIHELTRTFQSVCVVYACVFAYLQDMLWRCITTHSRIQLRHRLLKLFNKAGFNWSVADWLDTSYKAIHLLLRDYWGRTALQKIIRLDTKLSKHPYHSSCDTLMTDLNSWAHFLNDAAAAENIWKHSCFHRWATFTPLMSHLLRPQSLSFIQPLHVFTFLSFHSQDRPSPSTMLLMHCHHSSTLQQRPLHAPPSASQSTKLSRKLL